MGKRQKRGFDDVGGFSRTAGQVGPMGSVSAFSQSAEFIATCTRNAADPHVSIWRIEDDQMDHVVRPTIRAGGADLVGDKVCATHLSWIPDRSSLLLVIGLSTGAVVVWDSKTGKEVEDESGVLSHSSSDVGARGRPVGLCCCVLRSKVYRVLTCGPRNLVTNWEIFAGKKRSTRCVSKHEFDSIELTAIGCSLDGKFVAVAGEVLNLFSATSVVGKALSFDKLSQCAGHASPIRMIEFSHDGSTFATAADSDRYIALWGVEKSSTTVTARKVFSMESFPSSLKLIMDKGTRRIILAALSMQGVCHMWILSGEGEDEHASFSMNAKEGGIFAFSVDGDRGTCYSAAGSIAKPMFLRSTRYSSRNGGGLDENLGFGHVTTLTGAQQRAPLPQSNVDVLGPGDIFPEQSRVKLPINRNETLGDQIEVLDLPRAAMMDVKLGTEFMDAPSAAFSSDSLSLLLQQALTSGDNEMMEHCLSVHESRIIHTTVSKLRPAAASNLLKELTSKIEKRPSRSNSLLVWVRALLLGHTSFLISLPNTRGILHALRSITEARVGMAARLERLSGRLDLVMAQIDTRKDYLLKRKSPEIPQIVYDESDDDSFEFSDSSYEDSSEEDDGIVLGE